MATTKATKRKPKTAAEKAAFSNKVSELSKEGYADPKQRVAIAYSELRKGGVKRLKQSKGK